MVGTPDKKETECRYSTREVGYDEDMFAVITVGDHASDGTDEEWGEHAHDEEAPDSEPGLGEYCDERSGSDKIEPIPQEADNLPKPEQAKITITANESTVSNRCAAIGSCFAQGGSPGLR